MDDIDMNASCSDDALGLTPQNVLFAALGAVVMTMTSSRSHGFQSFPRARCIACSITVTSMDKAIRDIERVNCDTSAASVVHITWTCASCLLPARKPSSIAQAT